MRKTIKTIKARLDIKSMRFQPFTLQSFRWKCLQFRPAMLPCSSALQFCPAVLPCKSALQFCPAILLANLPSNSVSNLPCKSALLFCPVILIFDSALQSCCYSTL
jgi:hypothetical protein